ncbi:MAG: hypothetical protein B7Z73_01870 [Planctomycetia bacterium 21-64-5]|nr:MAG: hypothetical protein B7Z73_01870 [Planctomycetia bacterium 21-64-5]
MQAEIMFQVLAAFCPHALMSIWSMVAGLAMPSVVPIELTDRIASILVMPDCLPGLPGIVGSENGPSRCAS